jgi:hypothetical protein
MGGSGVSTLSASVAVRPSFGGVQGDGTSTAPVTYGWYTKACFLTGCMPALVGPNNGTFGYIPAPPIACNAGAVGTVVKMIGNANNMSNDYILGCFSSKVENFDSVMSKTPIQTFGSVSAATAQVVAAQNPIPVATAPVAATTSNSTTAQPSYYEVAIAPTYYSTKYRALTMRTAEKPYCWGDNWTDYYNFAWHQKERMCQCPGDFSSWDPSGEGCYVREIPGTLASSAVDSNALLQRMVGQNLTGQNNTTAVSANTAAATPAAVVSSCTTGSFTNANKELTQFKCNCGGDVDGWSSVGGGCYHKVLSTVAVQNVVAATQDQPAQQCSQGQFTAGDFIVQYQCNCGGDLAGWNSVGGGCYHRNTGIYATPNSD